MGIISGIKNMFDISTWMGTDRLKNQAKTLTDIAKNLSTTAKPTHYETFEEALKRLNLTEQDVINRSQEFKRLILWFSIITFFLLLYLVYLLFEHAWIGSLGCFGIMLVMIGQLFRYHFWLYQIHERKLGCTFREWLKSLAGKS